ncbi:hypothetical protein C7Y70_19060 [Pseudoalteromonas sp. KS88]|uniref:hypothetical protein n=1 Tax=Pseudoalteromonas sp. KS88 TaxID=2109918 RepID=UPI0010800792|nr:hypothetical protein [Pseudoalteromonas sp. KS88]TGE76662.1 hypothetical protein C7Y70_19060 [Pseudoalteromonas sp. KS88]
MRKFRVLDKQTQLILCAQFPHLDKLAAIEETDTYSYLAVSVFDHWLGEEGAVKYLSNVTADEQKLRDSKFIKFSQKLIENTEILNFTFRGKHSKAFPIFRKFTSNDAKEKYLACAPNNVDSSHFFKIVLPQLNAIYFESWDDTNVFYLRNTEHRNQLELWAKECGLHCLE